MKDFINEIGSAARSRSDLWIRLIREMKYRKVAEIGVFKGNFAAELLKNNDSIQKYYMIDPWRYLKNWNKPANMSNSSFHKIYEEALAKTDFAKDKRIILRGKTTEVINEIPDESLDFAYIDGDHTLRGITVDLIKILPKIKKGGVIAGDDFSPTIWQHSLDFEPTLVFPFAVYFAEAISEKIYGLPYNQFLIEKTEDSDYDFIDLVDKYEDISLGKNLKEHSGNNDLKSKLKAKILSWF